MSIKRNKMMYFTGGQKTYVLIIKGVIRIDLHNIRIRYKNNAIKSCFFVNDF